MAMTTVVRTRVTTQYSHSHVEYTCLLGSTLKSKKEVLKNVWCMSEIEMFAQAVEQALTAVKVAGKKSIVIAAMTRITALSREVAIPISCASEESR